MSSVALSPQLGEDIGCGVTETEARRKRRRDEGRKGVEGCPNLKKHCSYSTSNQLKSFKTQHYTDIDYRHIKYNGKIVKLEPEYLSVLSEEASPREKKLKSSKAILQSYWFP